ncbi:short-chain dehydrogenase/reductase [Aspergillus saccharolyticus JOP 1030-1]|uniref:Short-chain dehydrogenase/reductase n=1 Tax=Aspergillus saccharolyticus JOP 1030-1 TaxID=1450539 RepID=A0A318Z8D4_9EURO|nr:short-chain dehydrogenase/reductase [Aspergillus saccharolyticus JOP 1030-1]PYH43419.1 short-chain dehydrogenase/reductase [Aspergillus saccharolyticus JOP 1030-1]
MLSIKNGFALVAPASKGLGFAFAQQLLFHTTLPVIATARKNCDEVRDKLLGAVKSDSNSPRERLKVLQVDVTDESTIHAMTSYIRQNYPDTALRIAITVPGILHVEKAPSQIDATNALDSFKVNALGPMLLMKHLTPFLPTKSSDPFPVGAELCEGDGSWELPSHAVYAMMAARVGSISDNGSGGWYSYRASKASVFQLAKTFDLYLRTRSKDRALAVAMHPGTVQTDFTREYWDGRKMLQPSESADRLLRFLCTMGSGNNDGRGRCWDWKGEEIYP